MGIVKFLLGQSLGSEGLEMILCCHSEFYTFCFLEVIKVYCLIHHPASK